MTTLRVAAFQRRPRFDDVPGTVERVCADLAWCDDCDVQLAVFPECYLQGYASDRETIARRALTLDGDTIAGVLSELGRFRTVVVIGLVERRGAGYFNSAAVFRGGRLLGTYAKSHPNEAGFDAGTEYPIFEVCSWRFGINICNDANFPETALKVSQQNARLLCYPLNNMLSPDIATRWRPRSLENLRQRAAETGCWVVASDVVGEHADTMSYGCTCIVRPDGLVVSRAAERTEEVVVFDLT